MLLDTTGQIGDAMGFDRNIITKADAARLSSSAAKRTMDKAKGLAVLEVGQGKAPAFSADEYIDLLLKYLPLEIVGMYLFIITQIKDHLRDTSSAFATWLLCLLVFTVIVACLYDYYVLRVERVTQIMMSGVGIVVYVFASGGWFDTTSWYQPWYGTLALPIYALMIKFMRLPPLPENSESLRKRVED